MDELEPIGPAVEAAFAASDMKTAYDLLLPYAEAGNHEAEFSVGLLIFWDWSGRILGADQSEREHRSMSWIRRAAGHGNERAVRQMYSAYERGWYGLPKSGELEICWRGVVTFRNGRAFSDLSLAAECMDADAYLFDEIGVPGNGDE